MQCARIESQVRIQMANEMDEQLQEMERMYNERALNDVSMIQFRGDRHVRRLQEETSIDRLRFLSFSDIL